MSGVLRDAFKITNNCIVLTIPLIIFVKTLDLYSMFSKYHMDTTPKFLIASITILFMFCIFFAGWFFMVKDAVLLSKKVFVLDKDRAKETLNLFKSLLDGVGKFFLPFFGACLFYIFVIQVIAVQIVCMIGSRIIGALDEASMQSVHELTLSSAVSDNSAMMTMIDNMTPEQIVFFGKWSLLFMVVTSLIMYLLMIWFPEIIYKRYNPIKALGTSILKLLKDFKNSFVIFFILWIIGFVILFANTFALINPFAYLIISIIMFYFVTYAAVSIFLYYDRYFGEQNE